MKPTDERAKQEKKTMSSRGTWQSKKLNVFCDSHGRWLNAQK